VAYVPPSKTEDNKAKAWLDEILALCECGKPPLREDSGDVMAMIAIKKDVEKGIFPLKIRDNVITHANNTLKKKGLFPDTNDDDDDEMVFGDEDFPE